jgi:hypothetical protein
MVLVHCPKLVCTLSPRLLGYLRCADSDSLIAKKTYKINKLIKLCQKFKIAQNKLKNIQKMTRNSHATRVAPRWCVALARAAAFGVCERRPGSAAARTFSLFIQPLMIGLLGVA